MLKNAGKLWSPSYQEDAETAKKKRALGSTRDAGRQKRNELKKYRKKRIDDNREVNILTRNKYARVRREAERQFKNDIAAQASLNPKYFTATSEERRQ